MKISLLLPLLALSLVASAAGAEPDQRQANTVVLDETGVSNLRIQTATVEARDFEETVFALGRIEVYPGRRAVVSSRIAGRALEVRIKHDHAVSAGDVAVVIESRQAGDPPPSIALTTPISGLVSTLSVVPGEPVSPDRVLAEIVDLNEVYAIARVPEHLAARLKKGQSALITVAAAAGGVFPATLEHLGVNADAESGSVEAAFHVDNPGLVLRPGMRAEFSIVVDQTPGVTSIPLSALQGTPADRFVYVKDFDLPHAFVKVPVVVGRTNERFVEIVRGLLPADEVVTQGAYSLAFAGSGSLSLKEALDAAHGHAHNADGSEITASPGAPAADDHDHEHENEHESPFWKIVSGVLFIALLIVGFWRKPVST
ncbi:MAG TPA: efflux RND transporter periplasmic adaptor subunit [Opitutaceae bacterium]